MATSSDEKFKQNYASNLKHLKLKAFGQRNRSMTKLPPFFRADPLCSYSAEN